VTREPSVEESPPATGPGREPRESPLRHRYGLLLLALLASFATQGIAQPGRWQELIVTALAVTTLVIALRTGEVDNRVVAAAGLAGTVLVAAVAVTAVSAGNDVEVARLADALLVLLAPPAVVAGVVRILREGGRVTIQAVLGVLCLYLLLGMFCAAVYGSIAKIGGGFFANGAPATTSNCLYFSFTTLTTVGYGDLTAKTNLGHTIAVGEALLGQVYLVTVVAVLVANLRRPETGAG
jgi:hypothetical protein